jgi:predicted Rossmann fold nucleotide-binding protein DprA/Smf involved in DNA uptake
LPANMNHTQLALMLSRVPHLGPRGAYNILTRLEQGADIFSSSAEQLTKSYKLTSVASEYLAANAVSLLDESAELLRKVNELGISVITIRDTDYPTSLKVYQRHLPPVIYAYGNLQLLQEKRFAVVNSANMGECGSKATSDIAEFLIDEGLVTVTGHNNAPYQLALLSAKRKRAPVVIALDRGIINTFHGLMDWQPVAAARIWDPEFDRDKDLVISQFRLGDPWIGENSKLRDRMVFGLADVVIAGEVRPGGVMEKECLFARNRGRELYVCSFGESQPEGNTRLIESGCQPLDATDAQSQLVSMCLAPMFEGKMDDAAESVAEAVGDYEVE